MRDFYCRRGRVRGCWHAPRAGILACIAPLTAPLFSALTFSALLHIYIACNAACLHAGTPAEAVMLRREAVMCAMQRIALLTASLTWCAARCARSRMWVTARFAAANALHLPCAARLCIH